MILISAAGLSAQPAGQGANGDALWAKIDQLSSQVEPKCVAWRRDIHQHPELSWQEARTGKLVAEHLQALGLEVKTGVGKTGVVGILRGKKDTPVVALRADMDALPVTEAVEVPFASKVKVQFEGKEVGVMHACGHDAHTAILMRENGIKVIYTRDTDFNRFPFVDTIDPVTKHRRTSA